jgi:hypothetical protein
MLLPGRKVEHYFMFRHLVFILLFGLCGLVYNFSDPVASGSSGTLTVRIAAKCFRMILDRSFRLPLEVTVEGRVKASQNAICPTRRSQFLMLLPSLRTN